MRWLKYSMLPAVAALSAFFLVLPQAGADPRIRMVARDGRFAFAPGERAIGADDRIALTNDTDATHTAECTDCRSEGWKSGDVQPGQTVFLTFSQTGAFRFACRYHGTEGMEGRLTVGRATGAPAEASPAPAGTPAP